MNQQFFEKVLPTQGNICVVGIKGEVVRPKFADNLDDAIKIMAAFDEGDFNTFFALGTFEGIQRKAAACIFMRSFFVDIDCGEDKPYATQEDALAALTAFVDVMGIPEPIIVKSGRGIHAYWPFTEEVPKDIWKPYAEKFKELCLTNDLHIDESVTADAARVLRVPGSRHLKGEPLPVEIIHDADATDFDAYVELLGVVEEKFDLNKVEKGLDPDTQAIYDKLNDNFEFNFNKIAVDSLQGDGCAQIKYILEEQASCPEPLWYAGISVAVRCVDGSSAIHDMSNEHPDYTPEETERKAAQSKAEANWSHSCDAFARENSARCEGCPHRSRLGKLGPIGLGKVLRIATQPEPIPHAELIVTETDSGEAEDEAQPIRHDPNTKEIFFPDLLQPYFRGINGGIYFQPPPRRDKKGKLIQEDPELLSPNTFYATKRLYSPHDGECLVICVEMPMDETREFILPLRDVTAVDRLKAILSSNGVVYEPTLAPRLASYLMKWTSYLMHTQRADIMRIQQGWTEDHKSFVLGTHEYMANGETRYCPPSPMAKNVVRNIKEGGTLEEWKKAIKLFNDPGYEFHAFAVLCGFATPLIEFTNVNGVILSLYGESGNGKTGALYGALSIWGQPENLAVFDSTQNALMQRMVTSKNITFGLDEQSNQDGKIMSHVTYNISSGQPKLRMHSSSNQEREASFVTRLIALVTTNTPLKDIISLYKANTNAEEMRILEPEIKKPSVPGFELTDSRGIQMFETLKHNYGHAGPVYIKELFRIGTDKVRLRLKSAFLDAGKKYSTSGEYRFLANLYGSVYEAGTITNDLGLTEFDLERIFDVVGEEFTAIVAGKKHEKNQGHADVLGDYINKNIQNCLVLRGEKVTLEPRGGLFVRAEVERDTMWVSTSGVKEYLKLIKLGVREFENSLTHKGILVGKVRKQMAAGWKDALGSHNVQAYEIKMDLSHLFQHGEEEQAAS
jgi:hypothetical protein